MQQIMLNHWGKVVSVAAVEVFPQLNRPTTLFFGTQTL